MAEKASDFSSAPFPLEIAPSLQHDAEVFSEREGVSLNQFINAALVEKLDHLRNEEWIRSRKPNTPESRARFLALLEKAGCDEVEPGDELPEGYVRPSFTK